mgnify:CR=1 FL=1
MQKSRKSWVLGIGGAVVVCVLVCGAVILNQRTAGDRLIREIVRDENFVDLFLCNDTLLAVDGLRGKSEALDELLNREDAGKILLKKIQEYKPTDSADEEIQKDGLQIILDYVQRDGRQR